MRSINKPKCEILAPVGNLEDLDQIISAGADAVYIGLQGYSARPREADFTIEQIKTARMITEKQGVKMYIAVNAVVPDTLVGDLLDSIHEMEKIGVDAFIVSDIGLINYLHKNQIKTPIHASTLLGVYNRENLQLLSDMGVTRIILSSDLLINEIADLMEYNDSLEFEIVADGGVCFNSNRQCLLPHVSTMESFFVYCQSEYLLAENGTVIKQGKRIGNCPSKIHVTLGIYLGLGITSYKIEGRTNPLWYVVQRIKDMKKSKEFSLSRSEEIPKYMHYIYRNADWK